MTAMLDIVFIMLIFFIVSASFAREEGLQVGRSDRPPVTPSKMEPNLMLELLPGYRIRHEGRLIDVWSAKALMKRFHVEHTDRPIAIKLERGAKHGTLVRLIDLAYQAGIPVHQMVVI